jgi:hypothetical protein
MDLLRRLAPFFDHLEAPGFDPEAFREDSAPGRDDSPPLSLPFESAAPDERFWIRRAAEMAGARVKRDTLEARKHQPNAPALRGVHGKSHGCVDAEFVVRDDLEPRFQIGVFKPGARYRALARFSNAIPGRPDAKFDARGLSIKLLDVGSHGRRCIEPPLGNGLPRSQEGTTQDFLLVTHPTFFIKDVRDYTIFRDIVDSTDKADTARRAALFFARRPLEALICGQTLFRKIDDPFAAEYHSMLASLLGPNQAVKYVAGPLWRGADAASVSPRVDHDDPNFLREVMRARLDPSGGSTVEMAFSLVVPEATLPVEDPRIDWERAGARRVPVARLVIQTQDFLSPARLKLTEELVFSPWHCLREHKPLGSLSRARLQVYKASSDMRHSLNATLDTVKSDAPAAPAQRSAS